MMAGMLTFDVATPHLVGRRPELAMAARAIEGARGGRSTALVVSGGPGIGKTALLGAVRDLAHGFRIVSARGIQSEAALAYAGLAELLRPLMGFLPRLPPPQRVALEGALAMAPPGRGDRFAVYAATLGVLSCAAEEAPVLCLVDDAHAMDTPSVEAILFAARRLGHEGVVVVVATRPAAIGGPRMSGLATVHLGGLADQDARRLLRGGPVAAQLAPWVEEAILAAAAGNPLALRELPQALPEEQRTGCAPLSEPLRPGGVVTAAFRDRLEALPDGPRLAALLVACSTDGDIGPVMAALAASGRSPADLEAAEAAGVVEVVRDRVLMSHPVLRSVAIELAGGPPRRAAHRALADAVGRADGGERWAWHRAQSALGPDEEAAVALAGFAASAGSRTGSAAAAAGYDRAARLTADPDARAARLLAASGSALEAGRPSWALQLAGEALMLTADPLVRERAEFIRGTALLTTGDVSVAHRVLAHGTPHPEVPVEHRVERQALGTYAALMADDLTGALAAARRALHDARELGDAVAVTQALAALSLTRTIAGDLRGARVNIESARRGARGIERSGRNALMFASLALATAYAEDLPAADRMIRELIDAMRSQGAVSGIAYPLTAAAAIGMRMGAWAEALAAAQESLMIAEESGHDTSVVFALVVLVRLQAHMGHDVECRRTATRAEETCGPTWRPRWRCWSWGRDARTRRATTSCRWRGRPPERGCAHPRRCRGGRIWWRRSCGWAVATRPWRSSACSRTWGSAGAAPGRPPAWRGAGACWRSPTTTGTSARRCTCISGWGTSPSSGRGRSWPTASGCVATAAAPRRGACSRTPWRPSRRWAHRPGRSGRGRSSTRAACVRARVTPR